MRDTRGRLGAVATVVVAWIIILAAVLGIGWLLTHPLESSVDPWDDDVVRWFAGERTSDLNQVADVGTFFGETPVGAAVAAVVAIATSLWRRTIRPALFFALVMAGVGGFYWFATELITRDRPPVRILDPGLVPNDSFPSGHVGTAIAVYGGIAVLAGWLAPRTRPWAWLLLLVPVFVALSRLYQGAHHPTDVLTSVLYTTAWLAVLATVLLRRTGSSSAGGHDTGSRSAASEASNASRS
jgi:undecaprenyl-diphosphatase